MPTKLLYLKDTYLDKSEAKVVGSELIDEERNLWALFCDQTVLYPQGGGQGCDCGWVRSVGVDGVVVEYRVEKVALNKENSVVYHYIHLENGMELPGVGSTVEIEVDMERRILMSNYHTVGHMLDLVGARGDVVGLNRAKKGDHMPGLAYVKFEERLDLSNKEAVKSDIESAINKLKDEALGVFAREVADGEGGAPQGKKYREVYFEDYERFKVGCGGTHIQNTSEVGEVKILDVRSKKGGTTIKYEVEV